MDQWWGAVVLGVVGVVVIVYGWLSDRVSAKRRAAELKDPPEREIPGVVGLPTPKYASSFPVRDQGLTPERRKAIQNLLPSATCFDAGLVDSAFISDRESCWQVLERPLVLVSDAPIQSMRELFPVLGIARSTRQPLVIAAPDISGELLRELAANFVSGNLLTGPIILDAVGTQQLCQATGANLVPTADLHAGYLSADALGSCELWVADREHSWVATIC